MSGNPLDDWLTEPGEVQVREAPDGTTRVSGRIIAPGVRPPHGQELEPLGVAAHSAEAGETVEVIL